MNSHYLYLFCSFFCIITNVNPSGVLTHLELGYRAIEFLKVDSIRDIDYKELILKHEDAFQAGSSFPDTFYNPICEFGKYDSVSEDTHWRRFMTAAMDHINGTYSFPLSKDGEKIVVFLFGILSHNVADISWHSLRTSSGFIRTMSYLNYHGKIGEAHADADLGADVLISVALGTDNAKTFTKWHIPTNDLVAIYKRLYGYIKVSSRVINTCTGFMYLARFGESLNLMNFAYYKYAKKSPFMTQHLEDYFRGGLDDMAADINKKMEEFATCLENEISCNIIPKYWGFSKASYSRIGSNNQNVLVNKLKDMNISDVNIVEEHNGITLSLSPSLKKQYMENNDIPSFEDTSSSLFKQKKVEKPSREYISMVPYSKFGTSLTSEDINGDGIPDLLLGSPVYSEGGSYMKGRVHLIYGKENDDEPTVNDIESEADVIFEGLVEHSRFGQAIAAPDFNADGLVDIVISAPSSTRTFTLYAGKVYVYLQNMDGTFPKVPSIEIEQAQSYKNFGWKLGAFDLNKDGIKDLVMGNPFAFNDNYDLQVGVVDVIFSKKQYTDVNKLNQIHFDWSYSAKKDHSWFGYSLAASDDWLAVGEPENRWCYKNSEVHDDRDLQSAGGVYLFQLPLNESNVPIALTNIELDKVDLAQFGSSVAFSSDGRLLALGAKSSNEGGFLGASQTGRVYLYTINHTLSIATHPTTVLVGETQVMGFGDDVKIADVNADGIDDIIVSAPMEGSSFWSGVQKGKVYIFYGRSKIPANLGLTDRKSGSSDLVLDLKSGRSLFGSQIEPLKYRNKVKLAVSSIHNSKFSRLAGKVSVFDFTKN